MDTNLFSVYGKQGPTMNAPDYTLDWLALAGVRGGRLGIVLLPCRS